MIRWLVATCLALCFGLASGDASAHHGWAWTTGKNIELTGLIKRARLGNPHGLLDVDVGGELWTFEVGQPFRHERVGLKDSDLAEGVSIRVIGEPSAKASEKRLKVERLFLGDKKYDLYPERD